MKLYKLMRTIHIVSSLALLPWMVVYATSAFYLNHGEWFNRGPQESEVLYARDLSDEGPLPINPYAKADEIVKRLALDGPHYIPGGPTYQGMTIIRPSVAGAYRIIWHEAQQTAVVTRRPFSFRDLVNQLHFTHGYGRGYARYTAWAVIVDLFVISIWLWLVSGIYMWASRGGKKKVGWISLVAGVVAFIVLVILLV